MTLQTEIKFTAQSNFIAGLTIGEACMSPIPPQKNGTCNEQYCTWRIIFQFIINVVHKISIVTIFIVQSLFIL